STGSQLLDGLAWISHRMLYVAVLGLAGSGLVMALQTGLPTIAFASGGPLPADFWAFPIRTVHYLFSRLLMGLIALHLAGALSPRLVRKAGLLRRMAFGRRAWAPTGPGPAKPLSEVRR